MTFVTNEIIINATLAGIGDAQRTYSELTSNSGYFSWAPEYLITVSVAKALRLQCDAVTVWPEHNISDALRDAGAGGGDCRSEDGHRRADLLLYSARDMRPQAIIEIKHNVDRWGRIADDLVRVRETVGSNGAENSFEMAIVAFATTLLSNAGEGKAWRTLGGRLARLADEASSLSDDRWRCFLRAGTLAFNRHEYWAAGAVVLERREQAGRRLPLPPDHRVAAAAW